MSEAEIRPLQKFPVEKAPVTNQEALAAHNVYGFLNAVGYGPIAEGLQKSHAGGIIQRYLGMSVFDRGSYMSLELPFEKEEPIQDTPVDSTSEVAQYYHTIRPPQYVVQSSVTPLLLENGFRLASKFDVSNLGGANAIHLNSLPKGLFGDYLLRDSLIASKNTLSNESFKYTFNGSNPTAVISRYGGDEFGIWVKEVQDDLDISTNVEAAVAKKKFLNTNNGNNTIHFDNAGIKPIPITSNEIRQETTQVNKVLEHLTSAQAIASYKVDLRKFNTELSDAVDTFSLSIPADERDATTLRLLDLLERTRLDPVTRETAKNLSEKYGIDITVYKNMTQLLTNLQQDGGNHEMGCISVPGILKQINDEKALEHDEGDIFLQHQLSEIVNAAVPYYQEAGIPMKFFHNGSDFYFDIPEVMISQKAEILSTIHTSLNKRIKIEKEHNGATFTKEYPMIPVTASVSLPVEPGSFDNPHIMKTNENTLFTSMSEISSLLKHETIASFYEYFYSKLDAPLDADWEFFIKYYNPGIDEKRGKVHLQQLQEGNVLINELSEYFNNNLLKPEYFEKYKERMLTLLKQALPVSNI